MLISLLVCADQATAPSIVKISKGGQVEKITLHLIILKVNPNNEARKSRNEIKWISSPVEPSPLNKSIIRGFL